MESKALSIPRKNRIRHGGFSEELRRCPEEYARASSALLLHSRVHVDLSIFDVFDRYSKHDLKNFSFFQLSE